MKQLIKKIGMAVGLIASTGASAVESPVDLSVPVENPALIAAITKHQSIGTNETAAELFEELKKAVFLVGMITEKPIKQESGDVLFKKGDRIGLITVIDNSNQRLLGLFTDHAELQAFTRDATSTLVMPAKMALEATVRDGYAGLVVNPAGQASLRLDREFILNILGQFR